MMSKGADDLNSSSVEAGPSTPPPHQSASPKKSSTDESSYDPARSSQKPTIPDGDKTVHSKQRNSHPEKQVPVPEQFHVHVEVLPQLLELRRGSRVSLRLTINDEVIYLGGLRTVVPETVGGSYVLNVEDGRIEHAFTICPRCDGWSEWVAVGRGNSPTYSVYNTCSLCHGDGTIPNEEYFRIKQRLRWRHRRRHAAASAQPEPESATAQGQGTHLRRSLADPPEHRDNAADSISNSALPTSRESPIRTARGQRRAREVPNPTVQPATSSRQRTQATSTPAANISSQSPEHERARNEILNQCRTVVDARIRTYLEGNQRSAVRGSFEPFPDNVAPRSTLEEDRRLEALEACIHTYLERNVPEPLPGVVQPFPDEVNISNDFEDGPRRSVSPESPHHTDRYRRAVRDFRGQGLNDNFMRLSMSSPPPSRRPTQWHHACW